MAPSRVYRMTLCLCRPCAVYQSVYLSVRAFTFKEGSFLWKLKVSLHECMQLHQPLVNFIMAKAHLSEELLVYIYIENDMISRKPEWPLLWRRYWILKKQIEIELALGDFTPERDCLWQLAVAGLDRSKTLSNEVWDGLARNRWKPLWSTWGVSISLSLSLLAHYHLIFSLRLAVYRRPRPLPDRVFLLERRPLITVDDEDEDIDRGRMN